METALAFPEPLPEDPEVVATALETAGIFGVQGDVREAVRWVRRAAELAGDAGIDDRAFALARAAADLTSNYSVRAESAPPAPAASAPPPAAPVNAVPAAADGAGTRAASAPPPPPPPPPVAAQARASNRPQESRPPQQAVSVSPIVSLGSSAPQPTTGEDEGEITSQHPPHRARPESTPPAQQIQSAPQPAPAAPSSDALAALFEDPPPARANATAQMPPLPRPELMQTLAYRSPEPEKKPNLSAPAEAKQEDSPTPVPVAEPTVRYPASEQDPGQRYAQQLMTTQVYEPVQPEAAFVDEPAPVTDATIAPAEASAPNAATQASARSAVRASIEQSQEEGVYILRLLKNDEVAPFGTSEALVVLVHPADELFADA
jgi:hypothetical protein